MENLDGLIFLRKVGLRSDGIGPHEEWSPVPEGAFQRRHDGFWRAVAGMIEDEPGEYEDLPEWMTEEAAEELLINDN